MSVKTRWTVTHACTHDVVHDLSDRPADQRAGFARWLASKDCADCWKAARDNDAAGKEEWLAAKRADYFEAGVALGAAPKAMASWVTTEVLRIVHDEKLDDALVIRDWPITAGQLHQLICLVDKGVITRATAKKLLPSLRGTGRDPAELVAAEGLGQVSDRGALEATVAEVVAAHPDQVAQLRAGKDKVDMSDFEHARDRVLMGPKREEVLTGKEKRMTAFHESGHALLAWIVPGADRVFRGSWSDVEVCTRAFLHDAPFGDPDHLPAEHGRVCCIVRDQQDRHLEAFPDLQDLTAHARL